MAAKVMTAAADVAHASISSLIGSSPIAVGAKLPDIEVKEDSPDAKIKINDHPGKVLFVCLLCFSRTLIFSIGRKEVSLMSIRTDTYDLLF
jgi:hypothetical protein